MAPAVRDAVRKSGSNVVTRGNDANLIEVDEEANEIEFRAVYKIVADAATIYRLRFAVLAEHFDDYAGRIDDTVDSFTTKHA